MSEKDNARFNLIAYLKKLGDVLINVLISDEDACRPLEDELVRIAAKADSGGMIPVDRISLEDAAQLLQSLRASDKFAQQIKNAQENGTQFREKGKSNKPKQEILEGPIQSQQPEGTKTGERVREIGDDY